MILDTQNLFSDAQAVTVTADSTNIIDLGATDRDIGVDSEIDLLFDVVTGFTAAGAATMRIQLITDSDSAFATTPVTLFDTGVLGKASYPLGATFKYRLSPGVKRWLKVVYTVATGPMTAGKVTAGIVEGLQAWKAYPAPNQA